MEPENVHSQHQQLQEEFSFGSYTSLLATPTQSSYKPASVPTNPHDWNPNSILNNCSNYNAYQAESLPNSRCSDDTIRDPQNYGSSNAHELLLEREVSMSPLFPTWNHHEMNNAQDLRKSLWPNNNFSFGSDLYLQEATSFRDLMAPNRSYISSNDLVSSSLSLNLEAFDFLRSANYDGASPSDSSSSQPNLGYFKSSSTHDDHYMMQGLRDRSSPSHNSIKRSASVTNGGPPVTKRPNGFPKQKEGVGEAKKSRSSCPPLKVRKEKLGDRIAALQKLVAPFGKTDTASVLTEAIGYIQFLHDQVQTLSVPYMNSNRGGVGRPSATMQGVTGSREDGGREGARGDLRSRGLCLVPQSCASFINGYDGSMWPPP